MRDPWISEGDALRERMSDPDQTTAEAIEARLPPYATAFLAHLRLLVGLPFEYLVPDTAMLPDESIRFFHLDRSWTDRVVDGVLAVGKVGTREQAHHHAAAPALDALLDSLEPAVRPVQRGLGALEASGDGEPAISGFVLRSAVVAGWPHLDIRAYRNSVKLTLLRLERLSGSVLIALFAGVPDRLELEEPHHGVQFGVTSAYEGTRLAVDPRGADGRRRPGTPMFLGLRATDPSLRVVELSQLRRTAHLRAVMDDGGLPMQTGSAVFAIELLRPPWKQVFSDEGNEAGPSPLAVSLGAPAGPASPDRPTAGAPADDSTAGDPVHELTIDAAIEELLTSAEPAREQS